MVYHVYYVSTCIPLISAYARYNYHTSHFARKLSLQRFNSVDKGCKASRAIDSKKDRLIWCELNQQYRKYGRVGGFFSHEESCMA